MQVELRQLNAPQTVTLSTLSCSSTDLTSVLDAYLTHINQFISSLSHSATPIGRIVVSDLIADLLLAYGDSQANIRHIQRFILSIKHSIRTLSVTVLVSVRVDSISKVVFNKFASLSDAVFSVESFVGLAGCVPAEFKSFSGFLHIHKLPNLGTLAAFRPSNNKLGIKRDRRKLHLEPLHLPPEDSRATASQTDADAAKLSSITAGATSLKPSIQYEQPLPPTPTITPLHTSAQVPPQSPSDLSAPNSSQDRISRLAAKFATRAPKGSSISISSVNMGGGQSSGQPVTSTHAVTGAGGGGQKPGQLCQHGSGLNTSDGQLDF